MIRAVIITCMLTSGLFFGKSERKVIGVMEKDPMRFPDTQGWGFEDFKMADPNQRSVTDMRKQCLSCHESQKANDYVYSTYHK